MVGLAVHHIQLAVTDGLIALSKFQKVGFRLFAQSTYANVRQWALRSGSARFVISEIKNKECDVASESREIKSLSHLPVILPSFMCPKLIWESTSQVDTVFNVAFEPVNIEKTLKVASENGAEVLHELSTISDGDVGSVQFAVIKSCLGNVIHTLIDSSQYKGVFLPGFTSASDKDTNTSCVTHFDHITFACHEGTMKDVMGWYEQCLGMKRLFINRNEDEEEGMVVKESSSGLRLKALEYWRCSEQGLLLNDDRSIKPAFVFAEAISEGGPNQIETFLQEHGCEGIQHIGLHTSDIFEAVSEMMSLGLQFMVPPEVYYSELKEQRDVQEIQVNINLLEKLSVLLDTEKSVKDKNSNKHCLTYLLQVFSKPLFNKNTFFLELIQREGSIGFGAGNIKALWRAVSRHMKQVDKATL